MFAVVVSIVAAGYPFPTTVVSAFFVPFWAKSNVGGFKGYRAGRLPGFEGPGHT